MKVTENAMKKDKRIEAIKYYGMIGMCLLHSSYLLESMNARISLSILIQAWGGICLPLYFFLSAFFFTNKYHPDMIDIKLMSRVKRIAIPYVFWNLLFIEWYALLGWMQRKTGFFFTRETYFPSGIKEVVRFIWLGYRNPPLWYLRVLMGCVLISPALYALFKKYKKPSVVTISLLILLNLLFYGKIPYASMGYWMPVYGAGMWCGIYCSSYILAGKKRFYICLVSCMMFFLFICTLYFKADVSYISYFKYCGWMIMPFILLEISKILPQKELYRGMHDAEFLLYCLHYPLIRFFDALLDNFFIPASNKHILGKWCLVVFLTLLIAHVFSFIIQKYLKRAYLFFNGKY